MEKDELLIGRSPYGPCPPEEADLFFREMQEMEAAGEFDGLFKGECRGPETPTRQGLIASINPEMHLKRSFFKRIYGYEITWPGFAEEALTALEGVGCGLAREHYRKTVDDYEEEYQSKIKEAASEYFRSQEKRGEGPRDRTEKSPQQRRSENLINSLRMLVNKGSE